MTKLILPFVIGCCAAAHAQAPSPVSYANVDAIINQAVDSALIPGGVLVIGHNGSVIYEKAYGSRALSSTS